MPKRFRTQIRKALDDPALQAALDGNAERRQQAFRQAYASLPEDFKVLRRRAHAVRARTIAELDSYLAIFTAKARANGIIIHQAPSGEAAVKIVRQIAQGMDINGDRKKIVAKSKSMVSEEIHLNQALEADGIKVVETDLGEYIVQLRGEPPAHIVTPAVHLNRDQVGATFHQELDIPFTNDIPELTRAARRVLREAFLEADIGVSGVNFGVAENGAICLLTNEGNGRMVTTLPDIHIALMGIERLVPSMQDLALMLSLLPRSSTGQKLTVYTNLIFGPRRKYEIDGPLERHLILIDNGRNALQSSALSEALYCIRCGACLNACPVFREIGGHAYVGAQGQYSPYTGPIGSVVSPGLFGLPEFGHLARASSLCGACQEACPVDIDLPKLLLRVRASEVHQGDSGVIASGAPAATIPRGLTLCLRLFSWAASSARRFHFAQRLVGFLSRLYSPFSDWMRLPGFTGWGIARDFPRPEMRPFRDRFSDIMATPAPGDEKPPGSGEPTNNESPVSPERSAEAPAARFAAELTELGGVFTLCHPNEINQRILDFLKQRQIERIQSWGEEHLPAGLVTDLRAGDIAVHLYPDADIKAGLTGAHAGVAETGSLIIPNGVERPLTASLLPEIHIAVLNASQIFTNLPQALQDERVSAQIDSRQGSSFVLVSGPSRTADIELTLTIGVHGPGEVHVFCLDDA